MPPTKSALAAMIPLVGGLICLSFGCAARPSPVIIFEGPRATVRLYDDVHAGRGHMHPAAVSIDKLADVLRGIRVAKRDMLGLGGLFGTGEGMVPAFAPSDVATLAAPLAEGFGKASPNDIVTFYLAAYDHALGKLVTSGGMYLDGGRLYVVLANSRTQPSAGPFEGTAYELDATDDPLFSIARYRFIVGFEPASARIPNAAVRGERGYPVYADDAKVLTLDARAVLASAPNDAGQPEVNRNAEGNIERKRNAQ